MFRPKSNKRCHSAFSAESSSLALIIISILLASLMVFPIGCVKKEEKEIKIGAVMPLTGDGATYGQNLRNGMELALSEINASGTGVKYKIIFEDDKGSVKDAVSSYQKLISQDKVQIILGPAYSGQSLAVAPIAEKNKIVALTTLPGTIKLKYAGDYVFRVYASDEYQGKYLANVAYNKFGAKRAAILRANSDYAQAFRDVFIQNYTELGGKIVVEEVFDEGDKNVRTQLMKIKKADPDIVFAPCLYKDAATILVQAKELGIKKKFLGGDAWDGDIWAIIKGAEELGIFSKLLFTEENASLKTKEFFKNYKAKYGTEPNSHAATGYDAVYLMKYAYENSDKTGTGLKDALYKVKDFPRALGSITFDSYGDNISLAFKLYKFKDGKVVEY
jgi:branched-chain amino acid transport system substrate-binding protein